MSRWPALGIGAYARGLALAALLAAAPGGARADWRQDVGTFRVGVVAPPGSVGDVPNRAAIEDAYAKGLGIPVRLFVAPDFATLIEAHAARRIHAAVYSATAYATAAALCACVEPLAAPVGAGGAIGIRAVLLTRDPRFAAVGDMAAHRIAIAPAENVAGHQLPLAALAAQGVALAGDEPFLRPAATAAEAEAMFAAGEADALFGWAPAASEGGGDLDGGTLARLRAAGAGEGVSVVWRSPILRFGPHAVLADLDPEPKRRLTVFLQNLLLTTPATYDLLEAEHLGGFVPVTASEYGPAAAIVRRLGAPGG